MLKPISKKEFIQCLKAIEKNLDAIKSKKITEADKSVRLRKLERQKNALRFRIIKPDYVNESKNENDFILAVEVSKEYQVKILLSTNTDTNKKLSLLGKNKDLLCFIFTGFLNYLHTYDPSTETLSMFLRFRYLM